ncbi:MAG TPA: SGNH/GDSL hydrolase family protein [Candidatus Acidoferrum sp.]|jgi:lysophospholipase L1-like esterase|nr:SGNH/GDSL hydrolase family protein [Candidatus Acidoferrum sp.]
MRRSAFVAATTAALAGCAHRNAGPARPASAAPPVRIVALGDSLALGTGASAPENGFIFLAYRRLLARRPGSRIDDLAIGGATAADVLRLQIPRLAYERADIAIVCVGGNDVVHRTEPDRFASTYAELVAHLRSGLSHARLILCGVPDVGLSPLFTGRDAHAMARLSAADDSAVRRIAKRSGAAFADLYGVTRRGHADAGTLLSDDRFHPSDTGYAAFADVLAPLVLRAAVVRPLPSHGR